MPLSFETDGKEIKKRILVDKECLFNARTHFKVNFAYICADLKLIQNEFK